MARVDIGMFYKGKVAGAVFVSPLWALLLPMSSVALASFISFLTYGISPNLLEEALIFGALWTMNALIPAYLIGVICTGLFGLPVYVFMKHRGRLARRRFVAVGIIAACSLLLLMQLGGLGEISLIVVEMPGEAITTLISGEGDWWRNTGQATIGIAVGYLVYGGTGALIANSAAKQLGVAL